MNASLQALLTPERLTEVVDVGANMIDGEPPYMPLLAAGLCRVTGFEPQEDAFHKLVAKEGPNERYLPYAVGDGEARTLKICRGKGLTSLLEPDPSRLSLFGVLEPLGQVLERVPIQTCRLDDVLEIQHLDFLKIDIQGGELAAFRGGRAKLAEAVVIQTEISFVTLYKDQPGLGDIDLELRGQGFIPHGFVDMKPWRISSALAGEIPWEGSNQLLEADIVYVRDFADAESMSDEQLKHLALISHYCYGSVDLTLRCVMLLEQRQALASEAQQRYLRLLTDTLSA
ncbi:FkbM family methyltransferase [Mycobacterium paraffinicum]|uniref:Methyltransferase FkbM domain-containing protein n=1 Tax=Mycobacterium paraffinicum TaxID=53378 RepID=A0ABP8RK68_9MYCO|nr:FkbM family methyltransferase [Mycobacterium paraffinicum]MCV7312787.1 FkbM family methyltransferase [Mycobacterium paraffinicum]